MTNRALAASLAAAAVTLSVTSSLIGLHRADAAERESECTADEACVETEAGQRIPLAEFEATSCAHTTPIDHLRAYAHTRGSQHGWGAAQHDHLVRLWTRESNWRWDATNPTSGAYGIPQALPASKLAGAGDDWKTNPCTQIQWGVSYIKKRYGSPAKAWTFWQKNNWY